MKPPRRKYSIIYADPPWKYHDKRLGRGGAENHYSTLSVNEIKALGEMVQGFSADNCALFIWGTWPLRPSTTEAVMESWGFDYKTCVFVWCKTRKLCEVDQSMMFMDEALDFEDDSFVGCGNYTRSNTEFCLLGLRGKMEVMHRDVRQIVYHPIMRHSEKPTEVRDRIVRLFGDLPRIELFARQRAEGWDAWGNEV